MVIMDRIELNPPEAQGFNPPQLGAIINISIDTPLLTAGSFIPRACNRKPVIKWTRIPVSFILEQIAEGASWDTLIAGYPELKKEYPDFDIFHEIYDLRFMYFG